MINKKVFFSLALILPIPCFGDQFKGVDCGNNCDSIKKGYKLASKEKIEYKSQCDDRTLGMKQGCLVYVNEAQKGADIGYTVKNGRKDKRQILMGDVKNLYSCLDRGKNTNISLFEMKDSIGSYGVVSITEGKQEATVNNTELIVAKFSRDGLSKRWDWDWHSSETESGTYKFSLVRDNDGRTLFYRYLKGRQTAKPSKIYNCDTY